MSTQESKLKLQAYLDYELSAREAEQVAAWLNEDREAKALHAELGHVKALLAGNEWERPLPESREFYWSKIERAIRQEATSRAASPRVSRFPWWLRIFAPAAALAAALMLALSVSRFGSAPPKQSLLHEIETPLEDTSAISFHSQSAGVAVVWVQSQLY